MSWGEYDEQASYGYDGFAADAAVDERRAFIQRTYANLFGAILAFTGLEALILNLMSDAMKLKVVGLMFSSWFLVLAAFMLVNYIAEKWAHSNTSEATQYIGLGLTVFAWSIIFMPLLIAASDKRFGGGPDVIPTAGFLTLLIFGGLTAVVMLTKKDFSFLGNFLWILSLAAFDVHVGDVGDLVRDGHDCTDVRLHPL